MTCSSLFHLGNGSGLLKEVQVCHLSFSHPTPPRPTPESGKRPGNEVESSQVFWLFSTRYQDFIVFMGESERAQYPLLRFR